MLAEVFNYEERLSEALDIFWKGHAVRKHQILGNPDRGTRGGVPAGKNLDGFREMIVEVVREFGPEGCEVHHGKSAVLLPGFFKQTNPWDMVITLRDSLFAAVELTSLCGPSFENHADECCNQAIRAAYDFRTAQGAAMFGQGASPFLGYFILVEDSAGSREPVKSQATRIPTDKIFRAASCQQRIKILCERMVQQQLYSCASVLVAPNESKSGKFSNLSDQTGFQFLLSRLAGHLASEAGLVGGSRSRLKDEPAIFESGSLLAGDWFTSIETSDEMPSDHA